MANTILTADMITRKSLEIFENNLVFTRNVNRQYDDSFAQTGAKIGSTLRIRLPDRALVTDGPALAVQDDIEQFTTLSVTSQKHVDVSFSTSELSLSMDDFAERVLKPRISQLAASVDADIANSYLDAFASVGTPGSVPSTALSLLQGHQKLDESAAPRINRFATINPAANAALVNGMGTLFNPVDTISRQFKSGIISDGVLGFDEINMSQSVKMHTTGAWGTTITSTGTVSAQGQSTLPITFTGSGTWNRGDVFSVDDVYAVNPQTRESTGALQQFVVTAVVTGTTTATLSFSPPLYTAAQALATVNTFPQANAKVNMLGAASSQYPQNLIYQKDSIAFATADLVMPNNVDFGSRQVYKGISMRVVRQYDINNDRLPCRVDVLYGYKVVRPAGVCRLWG